MPSPLCQAVCNGNLKEAAVLLEAGADPNKSDEDNNFPLHLAVLNNNFEMVKLLLREGAKPDIHYSKEHVAIIQIEQCSPLLLAIDQGNLELVKCLVEAGADIRGEINLYRFHTSWPPLHMALLRGNLEIIKYLIQQGADCNKAGCDGALPIFLAINCTYCENDSEKNTQRVLEILDILLQAGVNPTIVPVSINGRTPYPNTLNFAKSCLDERIANAVETAIANYRFQPTKKIKEEKVQAKTVFFKFHQLDSVLTVESQNAKVKNFENKFG
jgi:ankyrin repeat protein